MSRFDEGFDRDFPVIADRATPSPDAWASIQQRIADREPITESEIIMLTENTNRPRRLPMLAGAAAVLALVVGGIALIGLNDGDTAPADAPTPTITTPDTVEPTITTPDTVEPTVETPTEAAPTALPSSGNPLHGGPYTFDGLGVPVTLDIPGDGTTDWLVQLNNHLAVAVGNDRGFVAFERMGSFYGADEAQDPTFTGLGSIPPDDIDGWIEANDVLVDATTDTTIDGRPTQFRQVRVPDGYGEQLCPADVHPCIRLNSVSADLIDENPRDGSELDGAFPNSYWFIELDDFEPLGIWAFAQDGDMEAWLAEIAPLIDSITFGEPGPAVEGGTARVPLRVTATSSFTGTRISDEPRADGSVSQTGQIDFTGQVTGQSTLTGERRIVPPNGDFAGTTDYLFTGTIDGIGTGTITSVDEWTMVNGNLKFVGDSIQIVSGTGDFEGMTGTTQIDVKTSSLDGSAETNAGTATFNLVVPRSG